MSGSKIFYKFRSENSYATLSFDGPSMSVFDVKREVALAKKLKGDFDLVIANASNNQEYADDLDNVPRNSSILVSRNPPVAKGRGTLQKYLTTSGPTVRGVRPGVAPAPATGSASTSSTAPLNFSGGSNSYVAPKEPRRSGFEEPLPGFERPEEPQSAGSPAPAGDTTPKAAGGDEEDDVSAFLANEAQQWQKHRRFVPYTRGRGASQGPSRGGHEAGATGGRGGSHGRPPAFDPLHNKPPPEGYVCFRCGQKGHWISECPTIGDKEFDNRPRLKRTTGIPRSFLKPVDEATAAAGGVMVSADGSLVVATANEQAFEKAVASRAKGMAVDLSEIWDEAPVPKELACPICKKLIRDAVVIPCCGVSFCDDCIRNHLTADETHGQCPNCLEDGINADRLVPNKHLRAAAENHLREYAMRKEEDPDSVAPREKTPERTERAPTPQPPPQPDREPAPAKRDRASPEPDPQRQHENGDGPYQYPPEPPGPYGRPPPGWRPYPPPGPWPRPYDYPPYPPRGYPPRPYPPPPGWAAAGGGVGRRGRVLPPGGTGRAAGSRTRTAAAAGCAGWAGAGRRAGGAVREHAAEAAGSGVDADHPRILDLRRTAGAAAGQEAAEGAGAGHGVRVHQAREVLGVMGESQAGSGASIARCTGAMPNRKTWNSNMFGVARNL
ncbi:DWNN domain-containing protein [Hyaloraphidium curvatum]|nr:DWNN domain-containing protein [Hyaloraphidium curvatum]